MQARKPLQWSSLWWNRTGGTSDIRFHETVPGASHILALRDPRGRSCDCTGIGCHSASSRVRPNGAGEGGGCQKPLQLAWTTWHGPLEDDVPLRTEWFPLPCDVFQKSVPGPLLGWSHGVGRLVSPPLGLKEACWWQWSCLFWLSWRTFIGHRGGVPPEIR